MAMTLWETIAVGPAWERAEKRRLPLLWWGSRRAAKAASGESCRRRGHAWIGATDPSATSGAHRSIRDDADLCGVRSNRGPRRNHVADRDLMRWPRPRPNAESGRRSEPCSRGRERVILTENPRQREPKKAANSGGRPIVIRYLTHRMRSPTAGNRMSASA